MSKKSRHGKTPCAVECRFCVAPSREENKRSDWAKKICHASTDSLGSLYEWVVSITSFQCRNDDTRVGGQAVTVCGELAVLAEETELE